MSEIRIDPISGVHVIVAANRADRPQEFEHAPVRREGPSCPFCAGNESETPLAVMSVPGDGSSDTARKWQVRVVPNKYPALEHLDGPPNGSPGGLFEARHGSGVHEVIIESPEHHTSLSEVSDEQAALIVRAYRDRIRCLREERQLRFVQIFKNSGPAAGATLQHVHSQLIGLTETPPQMQLELENCRRLHELLGECVFCRMLSEELQSDARLVVATENFAAFCPFASRFAFEIWVLPQRHASDFGSLSDRDAGELAGLVKEMIRRLETELGRPAYNYLIHTAPLNTARLDSYHWHIKIFPRRTQVAGFELATGYFINPTPPEEAAALLRQAGANQPTRQ